MQCNIIPDRKEMIPLISKNLLVHKNDEILLVQPISESLGSILNTHNMHVPVSSPADFDSVKFFKILKNANRLFSFIVAHCHCSMYMTLEMMEMASNNAMGVQGHKA